MDLTAAVVAGGLMTAGLSLEVGPAAWFGAEAIRSSFSIGIELRGVFPAAALRYHTFRTSDLQTFSVLLVPCGRWKWLFGCGFMEIGAFTFNVPDRPQYSYSSVMAAVGPRFGVDVPIAEGFSVRSFADLALRPEFSSVGIKDEGHPDQPTYFWTLPVISGFFGLGMAWGW
jgi:hypothetical protein